VNAARAGEPPHQRQGGLEKNALSLLKTAFQLAPQKKAALLPFMHCACVVANAVLMKPKPSFLGERRGEQHSDSIKEKIGLTPIQG